MFPSGFVFENSTNVTISGCTVGPCPNCGGTGEVLEGTFDFVGDTIRILSAPAVTVSRLQRLAEILEGARARGASAEEIKREVSEKLPELSKLSDLLPKTRQELYAFIAIILAALGLLIQSGKEGGDTNISIDQVINNCVVTESAQLALPGTQSPSGRAVPIRSRAVVGRNAPCPCGSGRKYKHCHGRAQ